MIGLQQVYAQANYMLGIAYVKLERWAEAEEQFRGVTEQQADNVLGHRLLGNVLYLQGESRRAMVSWERALELNPSDDELRNTLESLRKRLQGRETAVPGGP